MSLDSHRHLLERCDKLLIHGSDFPSTEDDMALVSTDHKLYSQSTDCSYLNYPKPPQEQTTEIMCIMFNQFWMEFTGVRNSGVRPVSFVESFPIAIWISMPSQPSASQLQTLKKADSDAADSTNSSSQKTMSVMINIGAKICAQINHYQFCFLMRLADTLTNMADVMANETKLHEDEFREKLLAPVSKSTGEISYRSTLFLTPVRIFGCVQYVLCLIS